jgi:hypothetical protein
MSLVSKGFSCFASCAGDACEAVGMLPWRPSWKLPGGGRKLEDGLWKDSVGLELRLRLFETVRASLFTLPAMSCAGVMVCTGDVEGARAGCKNSIRVCDPECPQYLNGEILVVSRNRANRNIGGC